MANPPMIALTGGPCAGKTTVLQLAKKAFGHNLVVAPEAATEVFSRGYPQPGRDCDWSEDWQRAFQSQVLATQWMIEARAMLEADHHQARLILCDRGVPDGAAYWPDGLDDFFRSRHLDRARVYQRYQRVFHLESLACYQPQDFGRQGNVHRYETADEAAKRDYLTRQAWQGHPNWRLIESCHGLDHKIQTIMDALKAYI